jgi:hypothetical protein
MNRNIWNVYFTITGRKEPDSASEMRRPYVIMKIGLCHVSGKDETLLNVYAVMYIIQHFVMSLSDGVVT